MRRTFGARKGITGMYKNISWRKTPTWRPRQTRRPDVVMQDKPVYRRKNIRYGGFMGIERKFIDTVKTATDLSGGWAGSELDPAASTLCAPTKGTGPSDRDGDHIVIKQIMVKGVVYTKVRNDEANVSGPYHFAIYLVQDTQSNGAQLNGEDVMVATDPEEWSFRNLQYARRFRILAKKTGSISPTVTSTDGANTCSLGGGQRTFQFMVNCNIPVDFIGNAGTIADIGNNSIHIIACASTTSCLTCAYHARVRFVG